jgi:hypothetical protein
MAAENQDKPEFYKYDIAGLEDYRYATSIVVTNTDREFFISFVCGRPYETPRCVARVVVGEHHMREIIAVLGNQLKNFEDKKKGKGGGTNPGSRF